MQLSHFNFDLPQDLIAQEPSPTRDGCRLLVVNRTTKQFEITSFKNLCNYLDKEDALVFNNTKVLPARLFAKTDRGTSVEILLVEQLCEHSWRVLARPGKKLRMGVKLVFSKSLTAQVVEDDLSTKILQFTTQGDFFEEINKIGQMPLPPYIKREKEDQRDKSRYQTIYAKELGSVAAPTAGLHFSDYLFEQIRLKGISKFELTLHVGLGTFSPIVSEELSQHKMHKESYLLSDDLVNYLKQGNKNHLVAVGTTSLRALEASFQESAIEFKNKGETDLFITPGYSFKCVQKLLTNFHLPKSTLFILVCSLMGTDLAKKAYQYAIDHQMKFFSYGDAMLVL